MIALALRRYATFTFLSVTGGISAGCGALEVSDPTAIEDSELNNAAGAELLRKDALSQLYDAAGIGAQASGLLTDELLYDPSSPTINPGELLDRRDGSRYEGLLSASGGDTYSKWQQARRAAAVAMPKVRAYISGGARLGELFALRGFATLRLGEDICPGFPLQEIKDYQPVYGPPLARDEVFARALVDLDSALAYAQDSTRILTFARISRARVLLNLGQFAEAASGVAGVPTDYVYHAEYSNTFAPNAPNPMVFGLFGNLTISVANQEGRAGLDFVTSTDPRTRVTSLGKAKDGITTIYAIAKYPTRGSPIVLAGGVEARLIEAEAELKAGRPQWLTTLNTLRTNGTYSTQRNAQDTTKTDTLWNAGSGNVPGLRPLTDPGTEVGRIDLLFRERAFWLFATGHRLADLRRLIKHYHRAAESVFPSGAYRLGGVYATATSIPFLAAPEVSQSPAVTGCRDG